MAYLTPSIPSRNLLPARCRSVSDSDEMLVLRGMQVRRESAGRFRDSPDPTFSITTHDAPGGQAQARAVLAAALRVLARVRWVS